MLVVMITLGRHSWPFRVLLLAVQAAFKPLCLLQ